MNIALYKTKALRLIFVGWLILWVIFLIREDKDGQYASLKYLYTHGYAEGVKHIIGPALNDFLLFVGQNLPEGSTYELIGFKKFSIDGYVVRYYLWPLKSVPEDPDFKVFYGASKEKIPGYRKFKDYDTRGRIFVREDINL